MHPANSPEPVDRREFLRGAFRYTALAGVAGLAASAIARRAPLNGPGCGGTGICGGCSLLNGCQETKAASARSNSSPRGDSP